MKTHATDLKPAGDDAPSSTRRSWLIGSMFAVLLPAPTASSAQSTSSTKGVRIVVGFPAGQTTDAVARSFAAALTKELGKSVYIDNKAGANGMIGAQEVARSTPDGTTVMLGTMSQLAINPALYKKVPYDAERDFAPIGLVATSPLVLVANPAFPANNLRELITYAKQRPGKVDYASGGNGITGHLAMEMLQSRAGIKLNHVPYKGSPAAMNDVIGGQVPLMFDPIGTTLPQIKAGKLKALAVTSMKRRPDVGVDVATLDEQGLPGFELLSWVGFYAPAATPGNILAELGAAVQRATQNPDVIQALRASGLDTVFMPPAEFRRFLHQETERWSKAVHDANVQLD